MKLKNNSAITLMIKMVGHSCNMNCCYCYEKMTENRYIKYSTADQVIEFLCDFVDYNHVFILFHGGEPLLANKQEVKKVLDYIKDNFKGYFNIQFQTNGTLLDDEWISMFKHSDLNISISISLDPIGEKDLRKMENYSYREIVENNLKKYMKDIPNIGIISVAHKFNIRYFTNFVEHLIKIGIKNLTINKYRGDVQDSNYITEKEYIEMLKILSIQCIKNKWYEKINIQPLNSLFSNEKNKLCIYLANENKCLYFSTYFSKDHKTNYCDHIYNGERPKLDNKCRHCDIYMRCGGGCLIENKDYTFCDARKSLFDFIEEVKYGNKGSGCK